MADSTRSQDIAITKAPPRSDRFYSDDELWYFRTREQGQVGPFRYRSEAQSSLERFLQDLQNQLQRP
ncbi:MAG: DUF6316 family protein [Gammaproteobacteria bacterium]|jgi:hypothetical protein